MRVDPEATLRCWALDVDLAGRTYPIPALPAADWLLPITTGTWLDIVPGLLTDPTAVDDLLLDGELTYAECKRAAQGAVGAASGMAWWTALRLARAATDSWISGELTLRGVDPHRWPLAAYLAAAYRAATEHLEPGKRMSLDMELDRPPAGVPAEEWWDGDAAAQGFMSAMGAQGGG